MVFFFVPASRVPSSIILLKQSLDLLPPQFHFPAFAWPPPSLKLKKPKSQGLQTLCLGSERGCKAWCLGFWREGFRLVFRGCLNITEGRTCYSTPSLINKPPPLNRDNRDPNIKALKGRGFINHGSTLPKKSPKPRSLCQSLTWSSLRKQPGAESHDSQPT